MMKSCKWKQKRQPFALFVGLFLPNRREMRAYKILFGSLNLSHPFPTRRGTGVVSDCGPHGHAIANKIAYFCSTV
jgi:hypothetical protein